MQALLESLKETREKVSEECGEFEKLIGDISKEANESLSLRERVGMTHRSLTLIEMRQEKAMREALYEKGKLTLRAKSALATHSLVASDSEAKVIKF